MARLSIGFGHDRVIIWRLVATALVAVVSLTASDSKAASDGSNRVHVREYKRKDGTVVHAHDRAAPGTAKSSPAAAPAVLKTTVPKPASRATTKAGAAQTTTAARIRRDASGRIERSAAAKSAFQKSHPCPATHSGAGSCPGFIIDHVKPLACGGSDAPANMQWQTVVAAKEKDRTERAGCQAR